MIKICQNFQNIFSIAYNRIIIHCEIVRLSFAACPATSFSEFVYKDKIFIRCKFLQNLTSYFKSLLCLNNLIMPKRRRSTFQSDVKDSKKHGKKQKTGEGLKHHKRKRTKSHNREKDKKKRHSRRSKGKHVDKKKHGKINRSKSCLSVRSSPEIIDIAESSNDTSLSDIVIVYDSKAEHIKHTSTNPVPVIDNENECKPNVGDKLKCKPGSILNMFEVSKTHSVQVVEKDTQPSICRHSIPVHGNEINYAVDHKENISSQQSTEYISSYVASADWHSVQVVEKDTQPSISKHSIPVDGNEINYAVDYKENISSLQSTEYISSYVASTDWHLNKKESPVKLVSTSPVQHHSHTSNQCDSACVPEKSKQQQSESCSSRVESTHKFNGSKRTWQSTIMRSEDELVTNEKQLIFKVLCYNVLSQSIMEDHLYLYNYHDSRALDWEYRGQLLLNELLQFQAEILCLQEVQQSHLQSFYNKLHDEGYSSIYKQRTGNKVDGVAIYYKKDTFDLTDHTSVEYYQPGIDILNRDNVALVAKFAPKLKPSERIVVATTHLLFNPRRHDVKLAQIQLLLAEVDRFAFRGYDSRTGVPIYWPVIITGDMNLEPYTGVYELLTRGKFNYEGRSKKNLGWNPNHSPLGSELLPQDMQITDSCQHMGVLQHRPDWSWGHAAEAHLLGVYNGDREREKSKTPSQPIMSSNPTCHSPQNYSVRFGTGMLSHALNLQSVYTQDLPRGKKGQVTTFQDNWVVVDYMFFSKICVPSLQKPVEEKLKLIARYKLFSEEEAEIIGPIPNLLHPSDHYPLCAQFALLL